MTAKYYSAAETAKLVRKSLKEAFTGIKFSVRSKTYSGGASIRVEWTDGPTGDQVDAVIQRFSGADFDGMQDLKTHNDSIINGQKVHFGADYIFSTRNLSAERLQRAVNDVWAKYSDCQGKDKPVVKTSDYDGHAYLEGDNSTMIMNQWASDFVMGYAHKRSNIATKDSPTARSVWGVVDNAA